MELSDVLSDKPREVQTETPAAEAPAETAPEAPKIERATSRKMEHRDREQAAQGFVRDPATGQFSKKEEEKKAEAVAPKETKEPPKQELTEKERGFLKAAEEERKKRQELERRLTELESARAATPAQPAAPQAPTEVKGFWDDPEKYTEDRIKRLEANLQGTALQTRLYTAEQIARTKYPDFQETVEVFGEILKSTPGLQAQWLASPDPAEFAYRTGKNHKELQEVGNIDKLKEKIEKETRIKVEAEIKERLEAEAKKRAELPGSLSHVTGVTGGGGRPTWGGPTSLDNILK